MNAHARKAAMIDAVGLGIVVIYLLIGCGIYIAAYGKTQGISLSIVLWALLWPAFLVWWAINWIAFAITLLVMRRGLKSYMDRF